MSEPDEAFVGLVDEDDPNAPSTVVHRRSKSKPTKKPKSKKKVVRKVVRTPTSASKKPVGFYKDGKGTTRPITAGGKGKAAAKASKPVKVIQKIGKPVDWSEISKTRRYEDDAATLRKYGAVPIPAKGIIGRKGAPLIRWDEIDQGYMPPPPGTMVYHDYPHPDAPHGLLAKLRKQFKQNRIRVSLGRDPVNAMLVGPPGTGKTYTVKKFAEETQLPYYYIPSDPNLMSIEQLLGRKEIMPDGSSKWFDGTIIKALKHGGILHIDEWSLLPGEIQTRFHELLDANRRMSLAQLTGEMVKAHPDLFLVTSFNPVELGTENANPIPHSVWTRFKGTVVDYPGKADEMAIIKKQVGFTDDEFKPPKNEFSEPEGVYADSVERFMRVIHDLRRKGDEIDKVPSIREAIDFGWELKFGTDPIEAIHDALTGKYIGEDRAKIEGAVRAQFNSYR